MALGRREDPYRHCKFRVEIDGITHGQFTECSGLESSVDVIEYKEGHELTPRKYFSFAKFANIVLKWGITDSDDLWKWHKAALDGDIQRKTGYIIVLDEKNQEVYRYKFISGWPIKWSGPSFNATGTDAAVQSVELAHEGLEKQ